MWKNILLTLVCTLWIIAIGYSSSCIVAYIIGWPPFVLPLIIAIVSFFVIIVGLIKRRKNDIKPAFFIVFVSLFLSGLCHSILLGAKFEDSTYRGAVLKSDGYLYNVWGTKILNYHGKVEFKDDVIYLETDSYVYVLNYDGDVIDNEEFIEEARYGYAEILQHPFSEEYIIQGSSRLSGTYEDYEYLGETETADCVIAEKHDLWDLIIVDKEDGYCHVTEDDMKEIEGIDSPIRCFVVKKGTRWLILNANGYEVYSTENGIYDAYYDDDEHRLHYEDKEGERWYHQF